MNLRYLFALAVLSITLLSSSAFAIDNNQIAKTTKAEEQRLNASIGVAIIDTQTHTTFNYKGDERFPLNSTHKALLCAALLQQVDNKKINLDEQVQFAKSDLIEYSPITKNFTKPKSMSWRDLCSAAVSYSDNTAANLIHQKLGGPAAMNNFLMHLNDRTTRLDRYEPELNSAIPNDPRDTTTPLAIAQTAQKLVLEDFLSLQSRKQLTKWMIDDKVADALLRSVLPKNWKIADKTGAGGFGSRGIFAVVWPKNRQPVIIAIYIKDTKASMSERNKSIANIGKSIFSLIK